MPHTPTSPRPHAAGAAHGRRRTLLIALAVVAVLGVAAVLYSAFSASEEPTASAPGGANPGNAGNTAAPAALTARTLEGGQVAVPGDRPSVMLFFSVECGGCGPTAGALAQAQQAAGDEANFVAVDIAGYETEADVRGFLTRYQATRLAYAIDTTAQWIRTYQVNQLSTVVVLDSGGTEVFRAVEPSTDQISAELAKASA